MPIIKPGDGLPAWSELKHFEIITIAPQKKITLAQHSQKERIFIGEGGCHVRLGVNEIFLTKGSYFDVSFEQMKINVVSGYDGCTFVRVCGTWGDEIGGAGLFHLENSRSPVDNGDPVWYPKYTDFDSHYHDFDEYWIIIRGRGVVMTDGQLHIVQQGDCVATRMGVNHDFPKVFEPVDAIYFETTLRGKKRPGHLWSYRDRR